MLLTSKLLHNVYKKAEMNWILLYIVKQETSYLTKYYSGSEQTKKPAQDTYKAIINIESHLTLPYLTILYKIKL